MKNLNIFILLAVLWVSGSAVAQTAPAKPAQFNGYATKLNCTEAQLSALLNKTENSTVALTLAGGFEFRGVVQSSEQKYANLKTTIIRSTNFPGAVFSLSKRSDAGSTEQYVGRIISFQHSDVYELVLDNGQYVFEKKKFDNLVHTCNKQ
jgi:small nuclear ribonucleoprotein (snRNP)-like protein